MTTPVPQAHNPLHGLTLEAIVTALVAHFGWTELGQRIPVRCFQSDPSIASSLKFLRKTPWARDKVEGLYLFMQREIKRSGSRAGSASGAGAAPPKLPADDAKPSSDSAPESGPQNQ